MTADERIEKLLNRFGQTISDLPQSDTRHLTYGRESRSNAEHQVFAFAGKSGYVDILDCLAMHQDYICHLADVIDRMETALETAALTIDCGLCEYWNDDGCGRNCVEIARITDYQLSGLTEREFNDFVEGEGKTDA